MRDGFYRQDLIEAVETAYLFNRNELRNWTETVLNWKRRHGLTVARLLWVGLIRKELEDEFDVPPDVSYAIICSVPAWALNDMIGVVREDRERLGYAAEVLLRFYNGGEGESFEE